MSAPRRGPTGTPEPDPTPTPPRLATRLLARAFRNDPAAPAILGDLHEAFVRLARERGPGAARRWYWKEALLLAAGHLLRRPARFIPRNPSSLLQDAAYALRTLRRNPGFALFTAAVIGLGVGAATSVFSVLKPLVLAPLPFEEPDRLVWIANEPPPGDESLSGVTSRTLNLVDFRARARSFEGVTGFNAFFEQRAYTLSGRGRPERLVGVGVAWDFLAVLGVEPLYGRSFTADEGVPDGPRAVVLSHGFWQRRFGGDPGVVGTAVTLNDMPHTVAGVLPPTFDFSSIFSPGVGVDFLRPFAILPDGEMAGFQGNMLHMIGRLRPGVGPEAAQAELDAIMVALEEAQPDRWGLGAELTPLQRKLAAPFRPALWLLAAAAGTLLLIVCVNVSNLILARLPGREREVAVRKAMGASRTRLVRQLVLETLAVALAGAALGSLLAWGATGLVSGAAGLSVPLLDRVTVDGWALLFAAGVAVLTGVGVGLVPALRVAEGGEAEALREGGRGGSASRGARRLREGLVVAEVTLALVLLVAGGLLVRSFRAVTDVDLGFEPDGLVAWQLNPGVDFGAMAREAAGGEAGAEGPAGAEPLDPEAAYLARLDAEARFFMRLSGRVRAVPGVEEAGLVDALPLGRTRTWGFRIPGLPEEEDTDDEIFPHVVDPGYLAAMRIALIEGRNITPDDVRGTQPVVLMNESGVRRAFGVEPERAVGRMIAFWGPWEWEVVGVVEDVRHVTPESGPGIEVYFPMSQMADFTTMDLAVRSRLPAEAVAASVRRALAEIDPTLPTREWWTVRSTVDRALSARRFTLAVLSAFGVVALLLAGLGIYGVLASSVAERRTEIGIRMALGASAGDVVRGVLGRTLVLAGAGVVVGAVLALAGTRVLESLLYGVSATDPVTFVGMAFVLMGVAAIAGLVPAARAAGVEGVAVLRGE